MNGTLRNTFQSVYVINLQRRVDRWQQFLDELPIDWPFAQPIRVLASDWRRVPAPAWWTSGEGAWGCYRSHLRIIEDALNRRLESVLILEDDAVFATGFRRNANRFISALPDDWAWIYLGGQHIQRFQRMPRRVNDEVYKPHNVNRTHAYAVRGTEMLTRVYHHLLDRDAWQPKDHIDHHYGRLHGEIKNGLYVPANWIVGQREGKSNVAGIQQPRRFFRGAASLLDPPVRHRVVSTVAADPESANASAELLHHLEIDMGVSGTQDGQSKIAFRLPFEAPGLHHICSRLISEPGLIAQQTFEERVAHLQGWAWKRGNGLRASGPAIGGMHRNLCVMWREMKTAWGQLRLVVATGAVGRKSMLPTDPSAGKIRAAAVRTMLDQNGDNQFQLDWPTFRTNPDESLERLCSHLDLQPAPEQLDQARRMLLSLQG